MSRDTNFYYSFLVLPSEKRRAIVAVWDFCRAVDDAVDAAPNRCVEGRQVAEATEALTAWRGELAECYSNGALRTWEARQLRPFIGRFNLPRRAFDDLIDGVEMDLDRRRYASFDELYQYCLRVASAVGLICVEIFGYRNAGVRDYAVDLGVALQLTNIVRDVPADLAQGRLYVPLEDLARFRCTEEHLQAGVVSAEVAALLKYECDRARAFYKKARSKLPPEDARRLVAAEIMGAIYLEILRRIERSGYDVFSSPVRLSRPRRGWIAATTWVRTMLGAPWRGMHRRASHV